MKIVKIYARIIASIMILLIGWGFIAPPLVSSSTDIGLVVGFLVVTIVPVGIYFLLKPIFFKNNQNNQN